MKVSKKQLVVGLAITVPIVAVLVFARPMAPIQNGGSKTFWHHVCGVDLGVNDSYGGGWFYQPRDGWYISYLQDSHGQRLFRVPQSEAVDDYPEVVRSIKASVIREDTPPKLRWAAAVLERNDAPGNLSAEQFLALMNDELLEALKRTGESAYRSAASDEKVFDERWIRIQRFWLNIVFESVFFAGLAVFALWPWLRSRGKWRGSLHLGLLLPLLMLPYYCGYSDWTFTSVGPSGGVLYPWVIVWFRGFPVWTGLDQWALENFPKVLEPLSQSPGPMLSYTGGGPLGPVAALILGAAVALSTSTYAVLSLRIRRSRLIASD